MDRTSDLRGEVLDVMEYLVFTHKTAQISGSDRDAIQFRDMVLETLPERIGKLEAVCAKIRELETTSMESLMM